MRRMVVCIVQLAQTRLELEKDLEENKTQVTTLKKELEEVLKYEYVSEA